MTYYFDVLPVHPQPEQLESFTSYLPGLAASNRLRHMEHLARIAFPNRGFGRIHLFADFPLLSFDALPVVAACTEERLQATTFFHLVNLFGRSTRPQHASRFLRNSLADTLRFCPYCLAERPWYILPWRFLLLEGCPLHECRLLSSCPQCGQTIPLICMQPSIGRCPYCNFALMNSIAEPIAGHILAKVVQRFQDLVYLLSPQPNFRDGPEYARRIGARLTELRQGRRARLQDVAKRLGVSEHTIGTLERAVMQNTGASLQLYFSYADLLGSSLTEIINTALDPGYTFERQSLSQIHKLQPALEADQRGLNSSCNPASWTDTTLVEAMVQVIANLHAHDQHVTSSGVLASLAIGTVTIRAYPYAQMLLQRIGADGHRQQTAESRARCRADLTDYINQLKVLQQTGAKYEDTEQRDIEREEELFRLVQGAIAQLRANKEQVTQRAVGNTIGRDPEGLKYYPRIRALLSQIADETRDPQHKRRIQEERADELLQQVQHIIRQKRSQNEPITQLAIAKQIGVTVTALRKYSEIRPVLDEIAKDSRKAISKMSHSAEELLLMCRILEVDPKDSSNMPSLRYIDIHTKPAILLALTDLTVSEFTMFVPTFEETFNGHMSEWRLDGRPRTTRNNGAASKRLLPDAEDRLLFILVYLKHNLTHQSQGQLFGMKPSQVNRWVNVLLPILGTTFEALGDILPPSAAALRDRLARNVVEAGSSEAVSFGARNDDPGLSPLFLMTISKDNSAAPRIVMSKRSARAKRGSRTRRQTST